MITTRVGSLRHGSLFGTTIPMLPVGVPFTEERGIGIIWDTSPYEDTLPENVRTLRETVVQERTGRGERVTNGSVVVLRSWKTDEHGITLTFAEGRYFDCLTTHYSLDRKLSSGDSLRERVKIEDLLTPSGYARSPLSNLVGITACVVTSDGKIPLQERSTKVSVEPNSFHASIAEGLRPTDLSGGGGLTRALVRSLRQELGSSWNEDVTIVGGVLGISEEYLQPDIALVARLPLTAEQVRASAEQARGRWERVQLHFVPADKESVRMFMTNKHFSPHAVFALALAESLGAFSWGSGG